MLIMPKYRDILVQPNVCDSIAGFFKIEVIRPDGRRRLAAPWQPNLFLDNGFFNLATSNDNQYTEPAGNSWANTCRVGSGNTPPAYTDLVLANHVAEAGRINIATATTQLATEPYYRSVKITYRLTQGQATGTLREIGLGKRIGYGNLSTRALIKDSGGNPTEIIVAADEQVDITYEIRLYQPDVSQIAEQMIIDNVLYDTIRLPSMMGDVSGFPFHYGMKMSGFRLFKGSTLPNIGTHLTQPANDWGGFDHAGAVGPHVSNTYRDWSYLNCTYENYTDNTNGITAVEFSTHMGKYQMSFTQNQTPTMGIPHGNTDNIVFNYRHSWDRYEP